MMLRGSVCRFMLKNVHACRAISNSAKLTNHATIGKNQSAIDKQINQSTETKQGNLAKPAAFKALDAVDDKDYLDDLLSHSGRPMVQKTIDEPAIVKKFFISKVDVEQLSYPEVIDKAILEKLKESHKTVDEYVQTKITMDESGLTDSAHNAFKEMNLYGYNVGSEFGGAGYSHSERMLASEPEANNVGVAMLLNDHRLVCNAISDFGTAEQQKKYLPKLAKGDLVATTAFYEQQDKETLSIKTKADFLEDSEEWILNGTKSYVLNSAKSNLFLVLAQTRTNDRLGDTKDMLTTFLVDASLPGVTVKPKHETIGFNNLYQSNVTFKNVRLLNEHILSIHGSGHDVVQKLLISSRLQQGLVNVVQMKKIIKYLSDLCLEVENKTMALNTGSAFSLEAVTIRNVIAKGVCSVYAIESMLYLTTGVMDLYENTNVDVESSIVKIYSQENFLNLAISVLNFVDTRVTLNDHPINEILRNAIQLQNVNEPKDPLKLFVGIACIQYAGQKMYESIHKRRNPLFNPAFIMQMVMERESVENIKCKLKLKSNLHSAFDHPGTWVETSIERIRYGCELLMSNYGRDLPLQHTEIQRLSDAATLTYASFASLIRSSRSWCLKMPNGEHERVIASCVCHTNAHIVKNLMLEIETGPVNTFETFYQRTAKLLLKDKSYFPVHPLTRFF